MRRKLLFCLLFPLDSYVIGASTYKYGVMNIKKKYAERDEDN